MFANLREWYERKTVKLGRLLAATGMTPNRITLLSLIPASASLFLSARGMLAEGLALFLIAIFMDVLDGSLARALNMETRFGKLLDHFTDRCIESLYLIGLTAGHYIPAWMGALAVLADISPSYIRARGEAELKVKARAVGLFERKEKIAVMTIGSIAEIIRQGSAMPAIAVLILGSFVTSVQRLIFFKKAECKT